MKRLEHVRILMYSHDTFGLGHLRRCRAIAHALVDRFKGLHILIISGSPIAGAFDFRARVDFVKIPSVIKLHNGDYTSIDQHIDISDTLEMRTAMIRHTAKSFDPDIFIVDKEPLGLRGELEATLHELRARDCTMVLGLRDVMDSPELLAEEWARSNMIEKIDALYDRIWIYGPKFFWDPLTGLQVPATVRAKCIFTGFLERVLPTSHWAGLHDHGEYLLVTTGGGGDGSDLLHQILSAYERDPGLESDVVMVLGPFLASEQRDEIVNRANAIGRIEILEFERRIEELTAGAMAVVSMCGYNTFCELMSFDKRALMVPRISPRQEQFIRASRAAELGLVNMLHPHEASDPDRMAAALRQLASSPKPSAAGVGSMMNGFDTISDALEQLIAEPTKPQLTVVDGAV